MFGIGGTELLVILVVALIVLGPKSSSSDRTDAWQGHGRIPQGFYGIPADTEYGNRARRARKQQQEAEKELFGTEQKATAATKPAEAASPAAKPAAAATAAAPDGNRRFRKGLGMTEREDKTPVAPSGAAEEQEILLDSPIVESEDEPGAVDAPGVSGSKEPDEAAVESTPVVEEAAVEPVPPLRKPLPGIRKRRPPPMPTLRRGCPKSPRRVVGLAARGNIARARRWR